jgi:hypothetical protein
MTTCMMTFLVCLVGCQQPHPPSEPSPQTLLIQKDDIDMAWDETLDVLREHYFIPDRQDRRAGLIVSYPDLSKQWFEFWRDDAQGSYEVAESSLHTVRRTVEVRFVPVKGKKDKYEIKVCVLVHRKSEPGRQITSSSGAYMAFRDNVPLVTGDTPKRQNVLQWVFIGEDTRMENYLIRRIERRLPNAELTCNL